MWLPFILVLLTIIVIILVRTLLFIPPKAVLKENNDVTVNQTKAAEDLAEMIRCRTVSSPNKEMEDDAEFIRFEEALPKLFPAIYEKCEFEKVGNRALLFRWRGQSSSAPTLLMAHYDVVSAQESEWTRPPFEGVIEDGYLYGRGALDTKVTVCAILEAAEQLIKEGFVPKNDVYFAFGGDEEIGGNGAPGIVKIFKERGIIPDLVLDEGGAVCDNVFPGVKKPIALIGIAEKGMVNIEYSVRGGGGHASSPKPNSPLPRLARAILRVEERPFKYTISPPAAALFDTAGRHSSFVYRMIFANRWCFDPLLSLISKSSGGEFNAICRSTTAFTRAEGSGGNNVIPAVAKMVSNHRIIPGETVDSVAKRIEKTVADEGVEVRVLGGNNPSAVSSTDCEAYERVRDTASEIWTDAIVSPYLMVACSDARHWGEICDRVYRFSPMALTRQERDRIHGNDERISLDAISSAVEFYIRLMKKC